MALTPKQKIFVREYLVDLNATQAAKRAGYKDPNIGRRLITKSNVADAIAEAMQQRETRTQITGDRVIIELAKIGFGSATDYAEVVTKEIPTVVTLPDGTKETQMVEQAVVELRDTKKLSADVRAAIAGIKMGKHGVEVTRYDKVRALELLGRHLNLFDRQEATRQPPSEDDPLTRALKEEARRLDQLKEKTDGDQ